MAPWLSAGTFRVSSPDVVCINLGTNDLSTNNYDTTLLKQGYKKLLHMVRQHNPQAKIVWLTGTMLQKKELDIRRRLLDEAADEAHRSAATNRSTAST